MRYASVVHNGRLTAVSVTEHGYRDLSALLHDSSASGDPMLDLLRVIAETELSQEVIEAQPLIPSDEVTVAPLLSRPGKIVAAPVNYEDHQEEMKQLGNVSALGFFLKSPTSVAAHGSTVRLPYSDRRFDQEGELALVIGKRGRNIPQESVAEHIAGYTCLLDLTMRGGEDRSTRKSFDTFTPVGPHLVTPDEVGDLDQLTMTCAVNGTVRQDTDIKDLIWGVPQFVSYVSSVTTLEVGDIITTGTPAGVGVIRDGDTIEVSIDRIGTLAVTVSDEHAVPCPTLGANSGPHAPETITPVRERARS
ncbi:fumarylacetoacetate hydrolase family protein [Salinibacterium sp. dk2585]|uniref:fumarylacetoacetate hydrolase family protein n=1 Tax=unclassified Salinibacterium TaxID=2632331 RepID=UPI0011C24745|nr:MULTISPECIES: fumarylacetoacetate hydrolase family protein [unclassified Salinibacterium]QEE60422.1 fumarylacetoacetate hydrolase family protein [Salinibacterium sp. dk2585]TXK55495.1 fumarylacetoacetate hydrolase family protein [Salinibacterium sp. dk5596]